MKKRFLVVLMAIVTCLSMIFAFTSCGDKDNSVEYGVKYLSTSDVVQTKENWVQVDKDNYLKMRDYMNNNGEIRDVTVTFRLEFINADKDKAIMFFDNIAFAPADTSTQDYREGMVDSLNSAKLYAMLSKNVIIICEDGFDPEYGSILLVNENEIDKIPQFNKTI